MIFTIYLNDSTSGIIPQEIGVAAPIAPIAPVETIPASEEDLPETDRQELQSACDQATTFVLELQKFAQPENPEKDVKITFFSWVQTDKKGKFKSIENSSYDMTQLPIELLQINESENNSLTELTFQPNRNILGTNNLEFKRDTLRKIECDVEKNECVCVFNKTKEKATIPFPLLPPSALKSG